MSNVKRAPESDEVALTEIRQLARQLGRTPGRNQLMNKFGWGAHRSTRLLGLFADQTTGPKPVRPAAAQSADQTASPEPDQSPPEEQTASPESDQSPPEEQTTPPEPDQSAGPVRAERSARPPYGLVAATLTIGLSAFVAVWGGWVGLGRMVGFGPVNLLPGLGDGLVVNLAIALPLGIEAYAAAALWVAVGGLVQGRARWFAGLSAGVALGLGAFGQATYHLLEAQGQTVAPDWVVVFVSVLPVLVLGAAGALLHLVLEQTKR